MNNSYQAVGSNNSALFTLRIHRGDGMCLLAMNWKKGKPTRDFVGFAIEYREPDGDRFFALKNRLAFPAGNGDVNANRLSTRLSPIQKWRWSHFPRNPEMKGRFTYRVTPVFMNRRAELSYGESQEASIELLRETYPDLLNVTFTRGFVSSQAFVDRYVTPAGATALKTLLPRKADDGLDFKPTHPKAEEALAWMGFEARSAILEILDEAIADKTAQVSAVCYDLSNSDVVSRLAKLKGRLRIIIDDSKPHAPAHAAESVAAERLAKAGAGVIRQHMGNLQHNKTIVVNGKKAKAVVCGSTNFTWRGLYVQNNHAVVFRNSHSVDVFEKAFNDYWDREDNSVSKFGATDSALWNDLKVTGVSAQAAFSPHIKKNALLADIGKNLATTESSLFFSLAFLYQTSGPIRDAITKIQKDDAIFCYGISDHLVKGLELKKPDGKVVVVAPAVLSPANLPEPFKPEPTGGMGTRLHHKFLVLDFDKPTARVYFGSYNFSNPADTSNGENLLLIKDRRVATSFMVEAVRIFDHYHFRVVQAEAKKARKKLQLQPAPQKAAEKPWWDEDYRNARKIQDRELFA